MPGSVEAIQHVDLDLELVPADQPGHSRRPDLVVVHRSAVERVHAERGLLRASEALLVVEIVAPGSQRTDSVAKRGEYADAGIPHHWIVDITEPVSLVACHLAGDIGYQDDGAVTGTFTATEPLPVRIDLIALL
ncbi:hypothetical protein BA062_23375 [Prauserella flavalba]|uniref:Putative restriction endonuclease domain-containing protein n=1 Tax=Prauserella flavalba TaxID=1477506 RepID=A0A318LHW3_9PSEU|nr:hypothetical protein BA062_23375 [Prauserella flavalba]